VTSFNALKEQANALRKDKQYAEALALYDQILLVFPDLATEWEHWGKADCLRRLDRQKEALDVCRELYRTHPEFVPNRNLYGWCVYDLEIRPAQGGEPADSKTFFKAADAIVQLTRHEAYSPYERTVFAVLKTLENRFPTPVDQMLAWCDKLNPNELSDEPRAFTDREGKEREDASPLEKWYGYRTRALEALRRWDELIVVANEALDRLSDYHYNDEIWFRRRIATAKGALGDYDAAIGDLKALVRQKPDWFIQAELARLLHLKGEDDFALEYAVDAALNSGDLAHKWELFMLLGDLLAGKGEASVAEHYYLAAALRREQGWQENRELAERLRERPPVPETRAREQARALEPVWRNLKFADQARITGAISRIDAGRRTGVIRDDGGRTHFFRYKHFVSPRERLMVGTKVSFYLQPSYDKSKNRDSEEAVDVREIL
jgi:tetratricopeptide (TPR) repeat protein